MKKLKKILILVIMISILFVPVMSAAGLVPSIGTGSDTSSGTGCVLGPKVTQDLIGVLNAFRIAAPLLMIGFTIFETIKSLTQGDAQGEMKKVFNRLKKRFMYVVILIFIPTLVKLGLAAMGITDGCDLQVTNNTVNESSQSSREGYDKHVQYDDKTLQERGGDLGEKIHDDAVEYFTN